MKNLLVFVFVLSCSFAASAQFTFGIRGGLSSTDFTPKDLVILNKNDVKQFKISVDDAKYGFHLGLYTRFQKNHLFIQPEVLLTSNKIDYRVEDFENTLGSTIKSERYNFVDVPVNVGYKLGPLRIQAGPIGHFHIGNVSELKDLKGYREKFETMTWGVQYGFGLDIWRTSLDFKWERNFNNYQDNIVFDDVRYDFNDTPNRFVISLGFALKK